VTIDTLEVAEQVLIGDAQETIHALIKAKGLTQAEVARRAGIHESQLSRLLSDRGNPTLRTLARIAHALGKEFRVELVGGWGQHVGR
jgi:transcriptional regulator with XRE-family HTH domain